MSIGIRALRDSLSSHLREVQDGKTVTITDHGRVIARIVPVEGESVFERLLSEGLVTGPLADRSPLAAVIDIDGSVSDLVAHNRA